MAAPVDRAPWVIVAGGFHQRGGMDRANAALAAYLANTGAAVHLVAHEIGEPLRSHPSIAAHVVARPRHFPALAETLLSKTGIRVAQRMRRGAPSTRVVVNGGNCPWPDVNWMHAVHAAWPVCDHGAPAVARLRNRRLKRRARRRERDALRRCRIVIANSEATRRHVIEHLGIHGERVHTIYLGSDPSWAPFEPAGRLAARRELGIPAEVPTVAFVGALGMDQNKGFDVLWDAWRLLRASRGWHAHLLVAGAGWRLPRWRRAAAGARDTVHFVGFTADVRRVLAASDLLVSPVRYEAYGLNVHEALCCGVPVMVTRTAGVTERFDSDLSEALLPPGVSSRDLADRLRFWHDDRSGWRQRAAATGARFRAWSWHDMAAEFVSVVGQARSLTA